MSDEVWIARYEQLNERSRWYASQLWYVPFTYVALLGLGLEKALGFQGRVKGLSMAILALLSFGTFVHVLSVKYFERRAVREMQKLEEQFGRIASGGGSKWFLSFSSYLRLIPLSATFACVWMATGPDVVGAWLHRPLRWAAVIVVSLLSVVVWLSDRQRTGQLREEIRTAAATPSQGGRGAA